MTIMKFTKNPILGYAATEELQADTWGDMLRDVIVCSPTEQAFLTAVANAEEEFKEQTDRTEMPGAWRSAKCVLKNAIRAGVPLVDAEGKPKGKSAIEAAIKAAKEAIKDEKNPEDKLRGLLETAMKFADKHGLSFYDAVDALRSF